VPDGFIVTAIKSFVLVNLVMGTFAIMTWFERRLIGRFQVRYGPNRVGPAGLLQPIADLGQLLQ
jgi:NADH-quinone oxidoreductase subunit H